MNRSLLVLCVVLLAACGSFTPGSASRGAGAAPAPVELPQAAQGDSRTLIRRANVSVDVPRLDRALVRANRVVDAAGGSIERETISDRSAHLIIRLPQASLSATSDSLASLGNLKHRSLSTEDASGRSIDLDARIAALTASRDRLRALVERANSINEVITVERELARVQGELENLQGQQRHLRDAAAMATLGLSIDQPPKLGPIGLVFKGAGYLVSKLFVLD
jgi:hypothetical protein